MGGKMGRWRRQAEIMLSGMRSPARLADAEQVIVSCRNMRATPNAAGGRRHGCVHLAL